MTETDTSTAASIKQGAPLATALVRRLREFVSDPRFRPGEKLPPEHVLTERFEVSRSVLREAVSALRAEGLLVSRRGAGVFIAKERPARPFKIGSADRDAVSDTVAVLELRAGAEIEAAGLAATRRRSSDIDGIARALEAMTQRPSSDVDGISADLAFHLAIAKATRNTYFVDFLSYLGEFLIPRQRFRYEADPHAALDAYLDMLVREHREIFSAIQARDGSGAREAMRRHLGGAAERYQQWALELDEADDTRNARES